MPTDPIGFEQYDYDSVKYIYQDNNPNAKPLVPPEDLNKFETILNKKKTEKSKKDTKKGDKDRENKK